MVVAHGVKRPLLLALLLLFALSAGAETRFLSPLQGGQVIGPTLLEAETTLSKVDRVEFRVDGVLAGVARKPPFRVAYDFGTSPAEHTIRADVFAAGYTRRESAAVTTLPLSASGSINVDLVEV